MQQEDLKAGWKTLLAQGVWCHLLHACVVWIEGFELYCTYLDSVEGSDMWADTWTDTWRAPTLKIEMEL